MMNTPQNPSSATITRPVLKEDVLPGPSTLRSVLTDNARQIATSVFITLALSVVMAGFLPAFSRFWAFAIRLLIPWLSLEARLANTGSLIPAIEANTCLQTGGHLVHAAAALIFMLVARFCLRPPFRTVLIGLGALHLFNTAVSAVFPSAFPYTLAEHTHWLALFTIGLMLALPFIMLITHAIIERSLERRIFATLLICTYLILTLPIKLVAHAALILSFGRLATPTLFLLLGPAFDIFLLTALYAFVVTWRHNPAATG